ncbi:MAG: hypothetical protein CVV64_19420 [Candidatus Wallbacteria bacterium HGW-Wallbacteria-1]|uniref:Uncharacterized protein n=1 Tax=Candidatus Wallbacteria bacterium HGW-Wallbacteria-1 TaxID=2013854 RepID=A0A2N1PJ61_9BACT|nr:MAG: hypothetical protein CVV64_19420 [Candidatus Wallbacteria bacterium HGW-Wallbacteria-1]
MKSFNPVRIALVSVNTRKGHRSLSLASLASWLIAGETDSLVKIHDVVQGEDHSNFISSILDFHPHIIGFTCYCFNQETTDALAARLSAMLPDAIIMAGGPEASYQPHEFLTSRPWFHLIASGEGERTLELITKWIRGNSDSAEMTETARVEAMMNNIPGLASITNGVFRSSGDALLPDLKDAPLPHSMWIDCMPGVVYYEASRGCPFKCSYCTSSLTGKVREKPFEQVMADLDALSRMGVKTVNFADRTFNHGNDRPIRILEHFRSMNSSMAMQVEIYPERVSEALLKTLAAFAPGALSMEAGFQTSNRQSLQLCNRPGNPEQAIEMITRIVRETKVEVHTDLMAGMPAQTNDDLMKDLDALAASGAHSIQINTVKLLPGTALRAKARDMGIRFSPLPPHETLETPDFTYQELRISEGAATVFYKLYNTGFHRNALQAFTSAGLRISELAWAMRNSRAEADLPFHSVNPDDIRGFLIKFSMKKLALSPDDQENALISRIGEGALLDWALNARPGAKIPEFLSPWHYEPFITFHPLIKSETENTKTENSEPDNIIASLNNQSEILGWSSRRRFLPSPGLRMIALRHFIPSDHALNESSSCIEMAYSGNSLQSDPETIAIFIQANHKPNHKSNQKSNSEAENHHKVLHLKNIPDSRDEISEPHQIHLPSAALAYLSTKGSATIEDMVPALMKCGTEHALIDRILIPVLKTLIDSGTVK